MKASYEAWLKGSLEDALNALVRSRSQSAHDPARPPAFLRPHSLLLDYVDEPDKFPKATIHPLERLLQWVIQNELFSRV